MPHLDEGMLHTYLDDQLPEEIELHLRECAECRANLEQARLLKENADAILAGAAPVGVAMPSFEELQARAKSQTKDVAEDTRAVGQRRTFHQLRSLAWAATVVLAVAVGWYARSTVLQPNRDQSVSEGEGPGRLTFPLTEAERADSTATVAEADAPAHGMEQEEAAVTAELDEVMAGRDTPEVVGGVAIAADQVERLETRPVSVPEPTEPPARSREATEGGADKQPAAPVESTTTNVAAAVEARRQEQAVASRAPRLSQLGFERAATEPAVTPAAGGEAEFNWEPVDEATAESLLDSPVPTVDGFPVVGYATSRLDGDQAIRVLQRLDSGRLLELVITPEEDPDISADAKKGLEVVDAVPGAEGGSVNTVAVTRGNLRIRLTATLGTDSLSVLGRTISAER